MFTRPRKPLTFRRALLGALAPFVGLGVGFGSVSALVALDVMPRVAVSVPSQEAHTTAPDVDPRVARIAALSARHGCERAGLGPDVIPASAIILDREDRVRLVSFDRGWKAFTEDTGETLVAPCRK